MKIASEPLEISPALLLEVFDAPITFHRCLVPVTGGVTAALMLSQAIWTTQGLDPHADGWFVCSQETWTEETGLSRWEQETARKVLREAGLMQERRAGMPARLWFRVCPQAIWQALQGRQAGLAGLAGQAGSAGEARGTSSRGLVPGPSVPPAT